MGKIIKSSELVKHYSNVFNPQYHTLWIFQLKPALKIIVHIIFVNQGFVNHRHILIPNFLYMLFRCK